MCHPIETIVWREWRMGSYHWFIDFNYFNGDLLELNVGRPKRAHARTLWWAKWNANHMKWIPSVRKICWRTVTESCSRARSKPNGFDELWSSIKLDSKYTQFMLFGRRTAAMGVEYGASLFITKKQLLRLKFEEKSSAVIFAFELSNQ